MTRKIDVQRQLALLDYLDQLLQQVIADPEQERVASEGFDLVTQRAEKCLDYLSKLWPQRRFETEDDTEKE